jgi:hypothetical protein
VRRVTLTALTLALAAVIASPAQAKEISKVVACGASRCSDVTDRTSGVTLLEGSAVPGPPSAGAPFFRLRVTFADDHGKALAHEGLVWVPRAHLMRAGRVWLRPTAASERMLRGATAGLAAFPASSLDLSAPSPVVARVDEVVPAPRPDPPASSGGDWLPWTAGAAGAVLLIGVGWTLLRRRRTGPHPHPAA